MNIKEEKNYLEGKLECYKEITKLILESKEGKGKNPTEWEQLSLLDKVITIFVLFCFLVGIIGFSIIGILNLVNLFT